MIGAGEFRGYARVSDGVVYVYGFGQGRYQTFHLELDEESTHLECELTQWTPTSGERVVESGNEDCISGTITEAGESTSFVKWLGFLEPQIWRNANLEPFCS
jgi:hypothetical protein